MKAIVLAAGFATRMYPLTRDRAKPLLEVGPRTVIDWLVRRILAIDAVDELVVVANGRFHLDFERWAEGLEARVPVKVVNDGALASLIALLHLPDVDVETAAAELLAKLAQVPDFDGTPLTGPHQWDPH